VRLHSDIALAVAGLSDGDDDSALNDLMALSSGFAIASVRDKSLELYVGLKHETQHRQCFERLHSAQC
jgi:hypothetical protein